MKESLSRRSKSIHSNQSTQRQAIDKASQLISTLMQELAEQKRKYQNLEQLYFDLHYQHERLQKVIEQKQSKIIKQNDHIEIEQKKIKELHLEIARMLMTNNVLKQSINTNKIKNMSLQQQNQYLVKMSSHKKNKNENKIQEVKQGKSRKEKQIEYTESTQLVYLKTYEHEQTNLPLKSIKNLGERLVSTQTKPNRRKHHHSQLLQYGQTRQPKQVLQF